MTEELTEAQLARGRGRAYALIADLISRGPTASTLEAARASDALRRALDTYPDVDEAAADHQHVFGFSVPPYEGAFLDAAGHVGGPTTDALLDLFREMGFAHDPRTDGVEHISTQLRALAFLSVAEADAVGCEEDTARTIRHHARALLDGHVLRYFTAFASAVRATGRALPVALVELLTDVLVQHRSSLGPTQLNAPGVGSQLEGAPLDLDDEGTGIREIAAALATAARVGIFISRDDVAHLGRSQRVPRGFGERRTLIHNLLNTAAGLGALPAVIEELRTLAAARREDLDDPRYRNVPGMATLIAPWRDRLETTDATLARLAEASRNPITEPVTQTAPVP